MWLKGTNFFEVGVTPRFPEGTMIMGKPPSDAEFSIGFKYCGSRMLSKTNEALETKFTGTTRKML